MKKDNMVSLCDGTLAIIITILIMGLESPQTPSFHGYFELAVPFFAYVLSFFFIAAMWVKFYYEWYDFKTVNMEIMGWMLLVLFFASILPYATDLTQRNFTSVVPQVFYGFLMLCITLSCVGLDWGIKKLHPHSYVAQNYKDLMKRLGVNLAIMLLGFILTIFVWAPCMTLAVLAVAVLMLLPNKKIEKEHMGGKLLDKSRLVGFNDDTIAIILTILILALDKPAAPTLHAILEIGVPMLTYALSFFFVAAMWISLSYSLYGVEGIGLKIIVWDLITLFFISLLPYLTDVIQNFFFRLAPEVFFALALFLAMTAGYILQHELAKKDPNSYGARNIKIFDQRFLINVLITLVGLIASIFLWIPSLMIANFISAVILLFPYKKMELDEFPSLIKVFESNHKK